MFFCLGPQELLCSMIQMFSAPVSGGRIISGLLQMLEQETSGALRPWTRGCRFTL